MTNEPHYTDTIAAFVDGEPVLPDRLRDALSHAEGRDYLIDLLALRDMVVSDPVEGATSPSAVAPWRRTTWRALAAAAALAVAVSGGYLVGQRRAPQPPAAVAAEPSAETAPTPTVVVTVDRWQDVQKGGGS
jgi:hypothetical protein